MQRPISYLEFNSILSKLQKLPDNQGYFNNLIKSLTENGAKDFSFYRDNDKTATWHLALKCTTSKGVLTIAKATLANVTPQYRVALNGVSKGIDNTSELAPYFVLLLGYRNIVSSIGGSMAVIKSDMNSSDNVDQTLIELLVRKGYTLDEAQSIAAKSAQTVASSLEDKFVDYLQEQGTSVGVDVDYCPLQLAVGVLVETEHTDNFDIALEIAKDHLAENPEYYGSPDFTDEAIERIDLISENPDEDSYADSEVSASVKWRPRLLSILPRVLSNRSQFVLAPLVVSSQRFTSLLSSLTLDDLFDNVKYLKVSSRNSHCWLSVKDTHIVLTSSDHRELIFQDNDLNRNLLAICSGVLTTSRSTLTCTSGIEPVNRNYSSSIKTFPVLDLEGKSCIVLYSSKIGFYPPMSASSLTTCSLTDLFNSCLSPNVSPEEVVEIYSSSREELSSVSSDYELPYPLYFEALDYYRQAKVYPSFKDFVGYLRYTGEFKDYTSSFNVWEKLISELSL